MAGPLQFLRNQAKSPANWAVANKLSSDVLDFQGGVAQHVIPQLFRAQATEAHRPGTQGLTTQYLQTIEAQRPKSQSLKPEDETAVSAFLSLF